MYGWCAKSSKISIDDHEDDDIQANNNPLKSSLVMVVVEQLISANKRH